MDFDFDPKSPIRKQKTATNFDEEGPAARYKLVVDQKHKKSILRS